MRRLLIGVLGCWMIAAAAGAYPAAESRHMARAKDAIADEHWVTAIAELKAAADDPKEPSRAEALFWLAHCQNQTGEQAAALATIARLQRGFPSSPWLRFAQSLRLEIAQKLNRDDVLWQVATPTPPAPPAPPAPSTPPARWTPRPAPLATPPPTPATTPVPAAPPAPLVPPAPPESNVWVLAPAPPDTNLRIQALGSLIQTHPEKVIPLLKEIALDPSSPGDGRRAVFVLAQSPNPQAQLSVLEVAKRAAEPVRVEAVKELGRFANPMIANELLQVYQVGTPRVKREVVSSLGDRSDRPALLRIAESESDPTVRDTAIVTLGRAGGRDELRALYKRVPRESRKALLSALVNARDEDELIRIAQSDPDPVLRAVARTNLRLLGTPKALAFLENVRR
jgi:HEAT repeat protein